MTAGCAALLAGWLGYEIEAFSAARAGMPDTSANAPAENRTASLGPIHSLHLPETRKRNNSCRVADDHQDAKVTSVTCGFGRSDWQAEFPCCVTHDLAQLEADALPATGKMRVWTRRRIHRNSFASEHLLHAKHVIAVADCETGVNPVLAEDIGNANRRLARVVALRLGDNVPIWDSV